MLHYDTLNENQKSILPDLAKFASDLKFYLGGGTALALYYGHRKSVDFDWFTSAQFEPYMLAGYLRENGIIPNNIRTALGTLHCEINNVRVSFLKYSYPLLLPIQKYDEYHLLLASLDDLVCMKLAAVAQRGSKRIS